MRQRYCTSNCKNNHYNRIAREAARIGAVKRENGVAIIETVGGDAVERPKSRLLGDGHRAGPKHVNDQQLVVEFPAHNKGNSDGVSTPSVELVYEYHPKQQIAAMAVEAGAKIVFFIAGIRSGKSIWLVRELIKQIYVYDAIPNIMYLISPTNGMMASPRSLFTNAAGDALVTEKRTSDAGPAHFLMKPSRSVPKHYYIVELHSGEHPNRMRGRTVSCAGVDEAQDCKPEVMDVLRGRVMESGGPIFLAGTATFPGHWTKTEIIDRAYRCGKCHECVYDHYDLAKGEDGENEKDASGKETRRYVPKDHDPEDCYGDPRIAVITCSSFDNTFLSRDNVEQLRKDYSVKDPIIAQRELYAKYVGFEGIVYSRFDRKIHSSPYTVWNVPKDAYITAGLDFGANDPMVCEILARIGDSWHVIGEYYDDDRSKTIRDHVEGIKKACGPVFNRIRRWWYDPSARISAMEMQRFGLRTMMRARKRTATGVNWRVYRYEVVNSFILGRDEKDRPLFLVNPKCSGLTRDLESRKWKRYKSKGEDGQERVVDLKGHQVDRNPGDDFAPGYDHGTDAIEYGIVSEFVKGLYRVKDQSKKTLEDRLAVEEQAPKTTIPEAANIGRAVSEGISNIVNVLRKPGRMKSGW